MRSTTTEHNQHLGAGGKPGAARQGGLKLKSRSAIQVLKRLGRIMVRVLLRFKELQPEAGERKGAVFSLLPEPWGCGGFKARKTAAIDLLSTVCQVLPPVPIHKFWPMKKAVVFVKYRKLQQNTGMFSVD